MSVLLVETIQNTSAAHSSTPEQIAQGRAKAWVNFDGTSNTGGNCDIRDSFNVSSVTDVATGQYTTNFTTAFSNTNYAAVYTISVTNSTSTHGYPYLSIFNTGSNKISVFSDSNSGAQVDKVFVCGVFFGDS